MNNLNPLFRQILKPIAPKTSTDRMAAISQNLPTGNGQVVLDAVLQRLANMASVSSIPFVPSQCLRDDLTARSDMGAKKYGTVLRTNNGRKAIVDLYQELLDAAMYAMQARLEGDSDAGAYVESLLSFSAQVASKINNRG